MRILRTLLAGLGAVYDALIPPKINDHVSSRAQVSRGDSPGAVSDGSRPTAPASGHPENPANQAVRLPAQFDTPNGLAALLRHHGLDVDFDTAATPRAAATDPAAVPPRPAAGSPSQVFTLIRGAGGMDLGPAEHDEFDWVTWVVPAITKVLTNHLPMQLDSVEPVLCARSDDAPCAYCADVESWIDHVAAAVAIGIHSAAAEQ